MILPKVMIDLANYCAELEEFKMEANFLERAIEYGRDYANEHFNNNWYRIYVDSESKYYPYMLEQFEYSSNNDDKCYITIIGGETL